MIRTRFAPSPTGYMTIGNLRSALYEFLIAKHAGGTFILRIEDTDQSRYVEGATDVIYETLKATGLKHDEGPDIGGDYGPYTQSERKSHYMPYAQTLIDKGHAYPCFCAARGKFSTDRLEDLSNDGSEGSIRDEHNNTKYDRHCLRLDREIIEQKIRNGEPYAIRQRIQDGSTTFHDEVYGDITIDNDEMEDQILIKSDGMPTYNFANVVDDHTMNITHVVRGSEYLTSTPKYTLLYQALGWDIPVYVHLPLMLNEHGEKISKRKGDASITELMEQGFLPEAIINYIAFLGWNPATQDNEIYSLSELIKIFEISHISRSPSKFDMVKMSWMNGEHIKRLPPDTFYKMALPTLQDAIKTPGIDLRVVAAMVQSRVQFVSECKALLDFIDVLPDYDINLYTHKKMKTDAAIAINALELAMPVLETLTTWNNDGIYNTLLTCAEKSGLHKSQMLWPIRTALSGKPTSPCGASELCALLGKDESIKRITVAIGKLTQ